MEKIIKLLKELNLDEKETNIYINLLQIGTSPSSSISNKINIAKSTVRYSLENLVQKGLVLKNQKGNTTYFTAEHPQKLKNLLIIEKNKLENTQKNLDNMMGELIGLYNPYTKLPKVSFYEGLDGIQKVLDDSLTANEIIDSFADVDSVGKYIFEINKKYGEKRKKLNIRKRMIIPNTEYSKIYMKNNYLEKNNNLNIFRFLDSDEYDLYISFMIYDNKISYITMEDGSFIGVIIENKQIYNFHKNMFKFIWNNTRKEI